MAAGALERPEEALGGHRARISAATLADETALLAKILEEATLAPADAAAVDAEARALVARVRAGRRAAGGIDAFMQEYALSSEEGVVLMCLAEALLRVPDAATADRLIKDKIGAGQWERHLGRSESWFVNASTWGLMLTGRVIRLDQPAGGVTGVLGRLVARSGEPIIRQAIAYAMRMMGEQFVLGRTMKEALARAKEAAARGDRHSFDMLGEAAITAGDAERYFEAYRQAIAHLGAASPSPGPVDIFTRPSISVKLSALHPRYEQHQKSRVMAELLPRLVALAVLAREYALGLTIDAEEAERLDLSLDVFAALSGDPRCAGWNGLGLAVQAYQRRARYVIAWTAALARQDVRRIPLRLVKGAYWDSEIKRAQELGLADYPVFTRKAATDVSYLACARRLLADRQAFYPQFATHNAHTVAAVRVMARGRSDYEFQRLHGMGAALYEAVAGASGGVACRIYAPVGGHEDLLAYLVRRLLENGANTSFVNRLADDDAPIAEIVADPVARLAALEVKPHPRIPPPRAIVAPRVSAAGLMLNEPSAAAGLLAGVTARLAAPARAMPLIAGASLSRSFAPVRDPACVSRIVGEVAEALPEDATAALAAAAEAGEAWDAAGGAARAEILERAADLFEREMPWLIGLCVREAGKTLANALGDVREAVDFLRYYAAEARAKFAVPERLPGPTGEENRLVLRGRGIFACIAPWNFPVAIFTGQVAAALAAGNAVIAKPAEQTPLCAQAVVTLLHRAGVPAAALNLLPGSGPALGAVLLEAPALAGVAFTGSTETARLIARRLAAREGPIIPFIAETGGQNAMIVDSTALPEQAARDAVTSAFDSAGQRCSALRVLFVQEDIAPRLIALVQGAMEELVIGDPLDLATDIGPVIDAEAATRLQAHAERMTREGKLLMRAPRMPAEGQGHFVAPHAFEIAALSQLTREVFGPMLHVIRFGAGRLDEVCEAINATGYGLTLSVQSRIGETAAFVAARARVGNLYVNRNQIGAVVGAQPFGGEGLSGTGPKAGGPNYLQRFAHERVISTNTAAAGGNTSLLALSSDA